MRASTFLRSALFVVMLAGCGDSNGGSGFTPEADAGEDVEDVTDSGPLPSFDVPVDNTTPDVPTSIDASVDRPTTTDTGTTDRPTTTDTGTTDRPTTTDTGSPGMCPASCSNDGQCSPCAAPGETGNYCCISGLCLYMSGASAAPAPDRGTPAGDGGADGGGDGGADAGGDVPGDADFGDTGGDAGAGADAATG